MSKVQIKVTSKTLAQTPQKYCRVVITEEASSWHRLVETKNGQLEYHLGGGKRKQLTTHSYRILIRSIIQAAKSHQLEHIVLDVAPAGYRKLESLGKNWFYQTLAENLSAAVYEFEAYKTEKKSKNKLKEVLVCNLSSQAKTAFQTGLTIGEAVNTTRDIANTAGDDLQPSNLAKATQKALQGTKASVRILDHKTIKKLGMGLLHAVGKGAEDDPKFIIIEYRGASAQSKKGSIKKPIILIGKGITYDSGGLNVKPSGAMHDMHMDMSGGSAVIGTMQAIAKLKLKKNVVGLIPAAENAISAKSMRAGDIVTSMSGKTVEVLHTDAEGRMVLADALTYAEKNYDARVIIDIATLTGAALVALGKHTSALLTKNKNLQELLPKLGQECGDFVWPLPLWDVYKSELKSTRADVSNISINFSRYAGCIEGGTFLSFFAPKKIPWAHIDMAPRMESTAEDKLAKGATGEPVKLLVKFIESY